MKHNLEFIVKEESSLFPFLQHCFSGKPRNFVKRLLKHGQISVDDGVCTDYSRVLREGQRVNINLNATAGNHEISLPVIYEDEEMIVINKPAGMLSISSDTEKERTAYHTVNDYVKKRNKSGRIFIVHRLDRETSGVMLLAKNERMKTALQNNWNELVVKREYLAVVEGKVQTPEGKITSWLKQTKTLFVYSGNKESGGKKAVTNYRVTKAGEKYSLLDISLETGRKNQIRVHMKDIGHPVAGDKKYGAVTDPFGRLGLHASELILKHPFTGQKMEFKAAAPVIFNKEF